MGWCRIVEIFFKGTEWCGCGCKVWSGCGKWEEQERMVMVILLSELSELRMPNEWPLHLWGYLFILWALIISQLMSLLCSSAPPSPFIQQQRQICPLPIWPPLSNKSPTNETQNVPYPAYNALGDWGGGDDAVKWPRIQLFLQAWGKCSHNFSSHAPSDAARCSAFFFDITLA
jgi:hypothetical protein